jgi:hypothetical protein
MWETPDKRKATTKFVLVIDEKYKSIFLEKNKIISVCISVPI